jgi:hypothetical protein
MFPLEFLHSCFCDNGVGLGGRCPFSITKGLVRRATLAPAVDNAIVGCKNVSKFYPISAGECPWVTMPDAHYEKMLAKQLAMNVQTWAALQKHGVTEQSQLRLDFSYNAPSRDAAYALRALIQEQTDYDVRVESGRSFWRRKWRVEGTTQRTTISREILDQWVTWMVTAGTERACEFDGWGTSV